MGGKTDFLKAIPVGFGVGVSVFSGAVAGAVSNLGDQQLPYLTIRMPSKEPEFAEAGPHTHQENHSPTPVSFTFVEIVGTTSIPSVYPLFRYGTEQITLNKDSNNSIPVWGSPSTNHASLASALVNPSYKIIFK